MSVAVPGIVGGPVSSAKVKLDNVGLSPDWRHENGDPFPNPDPGLEVTAQNPDAGTQVPDGSSVKAFIKT